MTYKGSLSPGPPTETKGAAELTDMGLPCGLGFVKFGQMVDVKLDREVVWAVRSETWVSGNSAVYRCSRL